MGKTYHGGGSDFWKDYDGTEGPDGGSDFWDDQDMWRAMREADEAATAAENDEAQVYLTEADLVTEEMACANCSCILTGPLDNGDYQDSTGAAQCDDGNWHAPVLDADLMDEIDEMLENNVDMALEGTRTSSRDDTSSYLPVPYGASKGTMGNCKGCGQRYGHSIYCPVVNPNTTYIDRTTARRADAAAAFTSREYKDWSKSNRGGANANKGTRPTAVLVDMDGTIDDCGKPNKFGIDYVRRMHKAGHVIVIGTARTHEVEYERSHKWLVRELSHKYGIPFVGPYCRSRDDMRFACHFKKALIETLSGVYTFVGAIDDDRWCLSELRTIKDLDVVTAKPGVWDYESFRGARSYRGKRTAKHRNETQS